MCRSSCRVGDSGGSLDFLDHIGNKDADQHQIVQIRQTVVGVFCRIFDVDCAVTVIMEHDRADHDGADTARRDLAGKLVDQEIKIFLGGI